MTYQKTPAHQAKITAALKGRKLSAQSIERRTATRSANQVLVTHGHGRRGAKRSATYLTWSNMIQRCNNPRTRGYRYYGERGIAVCDRWLDFKNFLSDMGERPQGLTLDRIDSDGDYEPSNCRWADRVTQLANRRRSSFYDRPARMPECGHPNRPHKARGMCGACYVKWRTSR